MMNGYTIGISLLVMLGWGAPRAAAGSPQEIHITWEGLSAVVGQKVRVVMPDGARIQGKAVAVEVDALAVEIGKTSNRVAYPKGKFLVPRATLKAVDVEHPTKQWRIVCTAGGAALAIAFAKLAAGAGGLHTRTEIYGGMAAAAPVVGYLLGRAADRRTVTYVIAQ
jgi:hypothetical protein